MSSRPARHGAPAPGPDRRPSSAVCRGQGAPWLGRGTPGCPALLDAARALVGPAAGRLDLAAGPGRRWQVMADTDDLQAWIIGWPPGGALELHDHGESAGVVLVAAGALVETSVLVAGGRPSLSTRTVRPGELPVILPTGLVHDVSNPGSEPAVSVHVYGPRLRSMTYYGFGPSGLVVRRTERFGTDGSGRLAS